MRFHIVPSALAIFATALLLGSSAQAATRLDTPAPGARGIGDTLFPELGNGGYDAAHYDLRLRYPTATPEQDVTGTVTMSARAMQSLSRFDLDFSGDSVSEVRVNGRVASFTRDGGELVITPASPIPDGTTFQTSVRFVSGPFTPAEGDTLPVGWFTTPDGSVAGAQPDQAHAIFPVNDHPGDKATYDITMDVPQGVTAVANGDLVCRSTAGGRTVSQYSMDQPMASELVQLAVGQLDVIQRGVVRNVAVRDVARHVRDPAVDAALARTPDHLRWMVDRVGPFPFSTYGSLDVDQLFFYALETQTLSLYPTALLGPDFPLSFKEPVMVHELAHQWFGDSVAPAKWSDVWLNEGHATWYEWLYGDQFFKAEQPRYDLLPRVKEAYSHGDQLRAQFGPIARPVSGALSDLFNQDVYEGGAVTLFALRQVIGDAAFARVERGWAQQMAGRSVTTDDFIAYVSKTTGLDLTSFLRSWLYGTTTPPMPGHPDWAVLPPDQPLQARAVPDSGIYSGIYLKR